MRYFRSYPYGMQLLLFLLLIFTLLSAMSFIIPTVLPSVTGLAPADIMKITPASPAKAVNVAIWIQGVGNFITFGATALIFAYLATPRPADYLGMRMPKKKIHLVLAAVLMLGAIPALGLLQHIIGQFDFGPSVKADQKANDDAFSAFLTMPSFGAFLKVFVLMSIVPAFSEELLFRGVLLRFAKKRSATLLFPIMFSAAVFAITHTNIYGYLPIFLAGMLLAVIYYLTGSIWCSMLGHFVFNSAQVVISYISPTTLNTTPQPGDTTTLIYLALGGLVIGGGALYMLVKQGTPLPPNWTDDFTPEELSQIAE